MGGIEEISEREYKEFVDKVNKFRCNALRKREWYTDKSLVDWPYVSDYRALIGNVGGTPSVVEYGGGVPLLSLFFLKNKVIGNLVVIDTDSCALRQLRRVASGLGVAVDILSNSICSMKDFPAADLGVSFNALYGFSPKPDEHANPPKLMRPVISETKHKGFAVFRHLNNLVPWDEFGIVISEMQKNYEHFLSGEKDLKCQNWGYFSSPEGVRKQGPGLTQSRLYHVLGWDRKP